MTEKQKDRKTDLRCSNCDSGRLHMFTAGREKAPIVQVRCLDCGAVQEEFRWTEKGSMSHHLMLEVIAGSENLPR